MHVGAQIPMKLHHEAMKMKNSAGRVRCQSAGQRAPGPFPCQSCQLQAPGQTDARRRHGLMASRPSMHMSGAGGASLQRSYVGLSATACRSAAAAASPASSASVCSMAVMSRWGPSTPSSSTSAGGEVAVMVGERVWSQSCGGARRTSAAGCRKRLGRGRQEGRLAASTQGRKPP